MKRSRILPTGHQAFMLGRELYRLAFLIVMLAFGMLLEFRTWLRKRRARPWITLALVVAVWAAVSTGSQAQQIAGRMAHQELRYCVTAPVRASDGAIARSASTIAAFKRAHACPATGLHTGACPGWAIDHVIPLDCGGCDAVSNMQWLPDPIKSASGVYPKDRWERRIYCAASAP